MDDGMSIDYEWLWNFLMSYLDSPYSETPSHKFSESKHSMITQSYGDVYDELFSEISILINLEIIASP